MSANFRELLDRLRVYCFDRLDRGQELFAVYWDDLWRQYVVSFLLHSLDVSMQTVCYIVLGRQGKGHLASAFVGFSVFQLFWLLCEGVLSTFDALDYQDKKSNARSRMIHASILVIVFVGTLGTVTFTFVHDILNPLLHIPVHVAVKANQLLILLIPSLWMLGVQKVATKQLLYKRAYRPIFEAFAVGTAANAILIAILVQAVGLGFISCAISTNIARFCILATLYFRTRSLDVKTNIVVEVKRDVFGVFEVLMQLSQKYIDRARGCLLSSGQHTSKGSSSSSNSNSNSNSSSQDSNLDLARSDSLDVREDIADSSHSSEHGDLELVNLIDHPDGKFTKQDVSGEDSRLLSNKKRNSASNAFGGGKLAILSKYGKAIRSTLKYAVVGVPTGLLVLLEFGIGPVSALIVARMGSSPINVTMISLTVAHTLANCVSFPLAASSAIKLAGFLKDGDSDSCRTFSRIVVLLSLTLALIVCYCSYICFHYLTFITTNDGDTVDRVRNLSVFMVFYAFCHSFQLGLRGILRVVNLSKEVVFLLFLCIWVCGLGTSCYLCFATRPTFEIRGYLIGLLLGAALLAVSFAVLAVFIDWEVEVARYAYLLKRGDYKLSVDNPLSSLLTALDGYSLGHTNLVVKGYKDLNDEIDVLRNTELIVRDTGIEMEEVRETKYRENGRGEKELEEEDPVHYGDNDGGGGGEDEDDA